MEPESSLPYSQAPSKATLYTQNLKKIKGTKKSQNLSCNFKDDKSVNVLDLSFPYTVCVTWQIYCS
jgi:hypothetical protein